MKKSILTVIAAALILANFTGCDNSGETPDSKNNISSTSSPESLTEPDSDNESDTENSENSENSEYSEPQTESSDDKPEPVPVEFTDEDRELQAILTELYDPANAITGWFNRIMVSSDSYPDAHDWKLIIPEISYDGVYIQIPDNYYLISKSFYVPTTKAGMRVVSELFF